MARLPHRDDVAAQDYLALAKGETPENLQTIMRVKGEELDRMLKSDAVTSDVIIKAREEYLTYAQMRLIILTGPALDGLETVVKGLGDDKTAMAQVKAAEAILDRGAFPKQSRVQRSSIIETRDSVLPPLEQLTKDKDADEVLQIIESYQDVMSQVDALRRGAREIIDAVPIEVKPSPNGHPAGE